MMRSLAFSLMRESLHGTRHCSKSARIDAGDAPDDKTLTAGRRRQRRHPMTSGRCLRRRRSPRSSRAHHILF